MPVRETIAELTAMGWEMKSHFIAWNLSFATFVVYENFHGNDKMFVPKPFRSGRNLSYMINFMELSEVWEPLSSLQAISDLPWL